MPSRDHSKASTSARGPSIGARVRAARGRLGWSRETLAHRCDLSWSAIEQIESGRRPNPRPDTLTALSRVLGVTIDYLISGRTPPAMLQHQVLVYEDDDGFVDAAGPFLQEGMERSEALLVISTASNNGMLKQKLGKSAAQVGFVEAETWYLSPVSAMNAYRKFLDEKLEQGAAWARIVGDPGWPGRSDDEIRLWNQYESLVNMAFSPSPLTVLCTYDERTVNAEIVAAARLTHPWVVEGRELIENPMYQDPGEFVFGDAHETRDQ